MPPTVSALVCVSSLLLSATSLLLAAACRRRARLEREELAGRVDALTLRVESLEPRPEPAREAPPVVAPVRPRETRPDPPSAALAAGPTLISVPNLSAPGAVRPADVSDALGRRFAVVGELDEAGSPPADIARATGYPVGQVELILGLMRQAAPPAAGQGAPSPRGGRSPS